MLRNFFILFLIVLPSTLQGQSLEVKIDSLFSTGNNPNVPGAAVVLVRGDSIHFAKG